MKRNLLLAFLCAALLASGQQSQIVTARESIEPGLPDAAVNRMLSDLVKDRPSAYIHLMVADRTKGAFGAGVHPPLAVCREYYRWAFGFSRLVYAQSSRGKALFRWDGDKGQGEWQQLSGKNPLLSDGQSLMIVEIKNWVMASEFSIVAKADITAEKTREEAIALVRSFTPGEARIQLRADHFTWIDSCGGAGPQVVDFLRNEALHPVLETTESCSLAANSNTCTWQTWLNRTPHGIGTPQKH